MSTTNSYVRPRVVKPRPIQTLTGATDAIEFSKGDVFVVNRTGAVNATTLAAPTAWTDDWRQIWVANGTTQANTITVAGGLGGSALVTITFAATKDANVVLQAYNGAWYIIGGYNATAS